MEQKGIMIEHLIPAGKENAVSRQYLSALTGKSDRTLRKLIEQARDKGHVIINDQDGAGYYRPTDILEVERQYVQDTRRALSILQRRKHLRKILKAAGRHV